MGGISPPFTEIERRMRVDSTSVVEPRRMPPGVMIIRDPKWWSRKELNSWIKHIYDGQGTGFDKEKRFQWCNVPTQEDSLQIVVRTFQTLPHSSSTLGYTPNELLYARKMQGQLTVPLTIDKATTWHNLPVARTVEVYAVYRTPLFQHLLEIHAEQKEMCELIRAVARMEQYGPIHVGITVTLRVCANRKRFRAREGFPTTPVTPTSTSRYRPPYHSPNVSTRLNY
jgi:hypothetical protein